MEQPIGDEGMGDIKRVSSEKCGEHYRIGDKCEEVCIRRSNKKKYIYNNNNIYIETRLQDTIFSK